MKSATFLAITAWVFLLGYCVKNQDVSIDFSRSCSNWLQVKPAFASGQDV